ncbi:hypothetical protein [Rhodopseudomonas sp. WA056]|uniref:hypothetical protein n=1 Tax=Rhodopseudomonas sp. WA056 TaxID=2269367 RepID=UPI001FEF4E80|nr:hypothetical protein [Rhodopseudomonas sp. WA056]
MEEVLQTDPDLAFDAANRLLKLSGEKRIGLLDTDRILQPLVMVVHRVFPFELWALGRCGPEPHHRCSANRTSGPSFLISLAAVFGPRAQMSACARTAMRIRITAGTIAMFGA